MNDNDLRKIDEMFKHHVGIVVESFQHKLDIVVEGHQMLAEKIDRVEARLDQRMDAVERKICGVDANLSNKIENMAAELAAHRRDTEAHPTLYKVKEGN